MSEVQTTHKATKELGSSVQNGTLIWTSASGITKGDANSFGGCLRRWWYEQVGGFPQPSTAAQERGTKLHDEIEGYQLRSAPLVSPLALAGRHFIDRPGPGVLIEHPLAKLVDGQVRSILYAGAVPVAGHVDLYNLRGEWLDPEGELRAEPRARTLGVKDWKTTADFVYAKTSAELADNVQLITYAEAGFAFWPAAEHARLTHVYFRTKGSAAAQLSTVLVDREHVARKWEYAGSVVRSLADVARETDPNRVDGNRNACDAYRGCPHRDRCSIGSHNSLADLFGERGAESLLVQLKAKKEDPMSNVLNIINPAAVATGASLLAPPAGVGATIPAAGPAAIDAEMARLAAEEAARRKPSVDPVFAEAMTLLQTAGRGWPHLTGRAANAAAAFFGITGGVPAGAGLAGAGWIAKRVTQNIEDPAVIIQLAAEVSKLPAMTDAERAEGGPVNIPGPPPAPAAPAPAAAPGLLGMAPASVAAIAPAPAVPSLMPADVPASNPALAAAPVEGLDNAKTRELAAATATVPGLVATAALLTGAPVQPAPAPAPQTSAAPAPAAETAAPAPAKRGPGRPRKVKPTETGAETDSDDTSVSLFINAIPSVPFRRLEPYVEELCAVLCKEYGAADVRCAPKDGPLGYDKAPGAIAALTRKSPPPPGAYVIFINGDKRMAAAAEALRSVVEATGGIYVEGVAVS